MKKVIVAFIMLVFVFGAVASVDAAGNRKCSKIGGKTVCR